MKECTERLWQLETMLCADGDILPAQGECGCGDEVLVRLHRSQIPLVAELGGFVPADNVARATERLQDRLSLVVSLVRSHCKPDDPLGIVVDELLGDFSNKPLLSPLVAPSLPLVDRCLPIAPVYASGLHEHRNEDLFSDNAGGMQR